MSEIPGFEVWYAHCKGHSFLLSRASLAVLLCIKLRCPRCDGITTVLRRGAVEYEIIAGDIEITTSCKQQHEDSQ